MRLTFSGVVLRFFFALVLVLCTYNPSGYSYFHWVSENFALTPYVVLAGLVLLIGWGFYLKATFNSLGLIGVLASIAVLSCFLWLAVSWGWLSLSNVSAVAWAVELLLALLLTVGMCWSFFTRRASGQLDVDEIEDN
ncbi:MAG: DUF6524 family protein [Pseudomonadales bacterium]|jgi:hypothetical protein|nr:DUF6524 family protein [Pseudomonadales bacterium]